MQLKDNHLVLNTIGWLGSDAASISCPPNDGCCVTQSGCEKEGVTMLPLERGGMLTKNYQQKKANQNACERGMKRGR